VTSPSPRNLSGYDSKTIALCWFWQNLPRLIHKDQAVCQITSSSARHKQLVLLCIQTYYPGFTAAGNALLLVR